MRKIAISVAALSLLTQLSAFEAVLKEDANVHKAPSIYAPIEQVGLKGDRFEVLKKVSTSNNGTWYYTTKGYISLELLTRVAKTASINASKQKSESSTQFKAILLEDANVHEEASLSSKIIRVGARDDIFNVLRKVHTKSEGTWYKTSRGYISVELLKKIDVHSKGVESFSKGDIKVYKEPRKNSEIIREVEAKHKFKVYEERVERGNPLLWYRTDEGWINTEYLTARIIPKPQPRAKPKPAVVKKPQVEPKAVVVKKVEPAPKQQQKAKPIVQEEKPKEKSSILDYFIGLNLGYSTLSAQNNETNGTITLNRELDSAGLSYGIEAGVRVYKNYFTTINYERIDLSDVNIDNIYMTFGYQLENKFNPYLALLVGVSELAWQESPIVTSTTSDVTSAATIFGAKIGSEYYLSKEYSLFIQAMYENLGHKTDLKDNANTAVIEHNNLIKVDLGVRYNF